MINIEMFIGGFIGGLGFISAEWLVRRLYKRIRKAMK